MSKMSTEQVRERKKRKNEGNVFLNAPNHHTSNSNIKSTHESIQILNEQIMTIDIVKQELDIEDERCFFCNQNNKKHQGQLQLLVTGDKEYLKEAVQMYHKILKGSKMYRNIEALSQVYYHKICRVKFFKTLKVHTIRMPEINYHIMRHLHDKIFKVICTIIEKNIIEKRHSYFWSNLLDEYTFLMKKYTEEDGYDYNCFFNEQNLQKNLLKKYSNINVRVLMYTKSVIMPKDQEMNTKLLVQLEERDTLQKAAVILRKKILDIEVNNLMEKEFCVPEILTDFYTTLLTGNKDKHQGSIDCYKKVHSLAQDVVYAVIDGERKTEKSIALGKILNNLPRSLENLTKNF